MSDIVAQPADVVTKKELWERRAFEKQLLNVLPDLRAFARFLAGNPAEADDLVQDTVTRALRAYKHFDLSTNIKSWTFTILRNLRINGFRKAVCRPLDDEIDRRSVNANQVDSLELKEVLKALATLSRAHREVITLVRVNGLQYDETAEIMGCKLGTVKSRVNRADAALRAALGGEFHEIRRVRAKADEPITQVTTQR